MNLTLVVIGDGRGEYLEHTVPAIFEHVEHRFDALVMVDDSGDDEYGAYLDDEYSQFEIVHGGRRGMAGAVQAGFTAALAAGADHVLWIEEDMLLIRELPVSEAIFHLRQSAQIAQMTFPREPWHGSPVEMQHGCQLAAIRASSTEFRVCGDFCVHDHLFSLNPCVIPRRVLEMGWPSGGLGVGNESGMTDRLLDAGYLFGSWGRPHEAPYARHLGARRSSGWQL